MGPTPNDASPPLTIGEAPVTRSNPLSEDAQLSYGHQRARLLPLLIHGRRRTKSIKNPQGFSLKFEKRRSVCYAAFAAGVSHGAWRSPLCARFHTFPRNFVIFSMALRWVCLALARLWGCLVRSFIHFSNAFLLFWRVRHLPCSVALAKVLISAFPEPLLTNRGTPRTNPCSTSPKCLLTCELLGRSE